MCYKLQQNNKFFRTDPYLHSENKGKIKKYNNWYFNNFQEQNTQKAMDIEMSEDLIYNVQGKSP